MKVESGGVATSSGATTVLHKIKVKEETKDSCCPTLIQQSTSAPVTVTSSSSLSSSSSPPPRIGAIATITISNCSSEIAAVAKQTAGDAFPVDLDLKSRAKVQARDKVPAREDANGTESRGSSSPSPSSSPSSHYNTQGSKSHQTQRANSSSSARSPESDDQSSTLQPLKTESQPTEETTNHRIDETKIETNGTNTGGRCISAIFAAHSKLRRLLGTLVQFATDISPDTGDSVRALVLSLLSGSMSAEEFHSALQEATNFPLRGFVLPYLKHNLPSLQRDLSAAARTDSQTCAQYLRANEPAVLEAVGLTESAVELFAPPTLPPVPPTAIPTAVSTASLHHHHHHYGSVMRPPVSSATASSAPAVAHLGFAHGVKRRASDAIYYENGIGYDDGPPYAKRSSNPWVASHSHHHNQQPQQHHHLAHLSHHQQQQQQQQQQQSTHPDTVPYCWYTQPLHSSVAAAAAMGHPLIPSLVQTSAGYTSLNQSQSHLPPHQPTAITHGSAPASNSSSAHNGTDDEWKNIHVMLNCILGMVEKTKRALAILQKRGCTSPASSATGSVTTASSLQVTAPLTNGTQSNGNTQLENANSADRDGTFKRLSGEIVAQTIRATEDRVAEVKRRAEEAVQEVKRAAMAEVQRAVAAAMAESRANERLRSHRYLDNLPVSQQQQRVQQQQATVRPNSSFLRIAETASSSARTAGTATAAVASSTAAANPTSSSTDDIDKEQHLTSTIGSNCWNCGRAALETCGGCGIARYCGSFCQHRDWEAGGHHATCRSTSSTVTEQQQQQQERGRSTTPSPPRTGSAASDSDVTKTATSSISSASSVRSAK